MSYDIDKALKPFHNIREMLKEIPRELWGIFLPAHKKDLAELEIRVVAYRKREMDREKVMSMQKLCGFPLRPNQSLREVIIKTRIQGLRKDHMRRRRDGGFSDMA